MKKLKFSISAFLSIVMLVSVLTVLPTQMYAQQSYELDNGIMLKGRTKLPVRDLFKKIGATVDWEQKEKRIVIAKGDKKIALVIGSKQATVNNKTISLDVPATIIDGSTYVPVRFVAESLGAIVSYKGETRTTTLTMDDAVVSIIVSPAYNVNGVDTKFRPDPSYIYEYIPYEGRERLTFVKMSGSGYVWKSQYEHVEKSPPSYLTFKETKYGLYLINDSYPTQRLIKYPVYKGQSWTNNSNGKTITYTVTGTDLTLKTRVKNFTSVIEILSSEGIYEYYAANFGGVGYKSKDTDFTGELVLLKKR